MEADHMTFTIIKPDAVAKNCVGPIIHRITDAGFRIVAMKMIRLRKTQAEGFYKMHKDRNFYDELVQFMIEGPIVPMVLEKYNAVDDFRKLIGNTNPENAVPNSIRGLYGTDLQRNAIHGADSVENALREASFYFPLSDMFDENGLCLS